MWTDVETMWDVDHLGRLVDGPHLVFARTNDGPLVAHGIDVPESLVGPLEELLTRAPNSELSEAQELIERALGPTTVTDGPTYVVPTATSYPATAEIITSEQASDAPLRASRPDNWPTEEWRMLLAGRLGPWAMAVRGSRVIAIAHTPASSAHGAEAGAWTDPEFRGEGHAAAVTAAWAGVSVWGDRTLFYSTTSDNHSSQRVAQRLGLRRIGWSWRFTPPGREANHAHRAWVT